MSAPICPYCGDGMESIGTLNHIECATKLLAEVERLRSLQGGPAIAAPTIPTTTTNNGVTSCAFCGGVVDIEYLEAS